MIKKATLIIALALILGVTQVHAQSSTRTSSISLVEEEQTADTLVEEEAAGNVSTLATTGTSATSTTISGSCFIGNLCYNANYYTQTSCTNEGGVWYSTSNDCGTSAATTVVATPAATGTTSCFVNNLCYNAGSYTQESCVEEGGVWYTNSFNCGTTTTSAVATTKGGQPVSGNAATTFVLAIVGMIAMSFVAFQAMKKS